MVTFTRFNPVKVQIAPGVQGVQVVSGKQAVPKNCQVITQRARDLQVQQEKQKQQLLETFHKKFAEMDMSHMAQKEKMKRLDEVDKRRAQACVESELKKQKLKSLRIQI